MKRINKDKTDNLIEGKIKVLLLFKCYICVVGLVMLKSEYKNRASKAKSATFN